MLSKLQTTCRRLVFVTLTIGLIAPVSAQHEGLPRIDEFNAPVVEPNHVETIRITPRPPQPGAIPSRINIPGSSPTSITPSVISIPKVSTSGNSAPNVIPPGTPAPSFTLPRNTPPAVSKPKVLTPGTLAPNLFQLSPSPLDLPNDNAVGSINADFFEAPTRGTLFSWNTGTGASAGPDLSQPLATDRPDFTEASSTVGKGVAQLEFGYTYGYDNDGTTQTKSNGFGEPLLRLGVLDDWLEFRIANNYLEQDSNSVRSSGLEDLYLGFKLGLTPQDGIFPEMALIPQMTVPTGTNAFSSNRVLPGANWIYGWEITDRISTAGSTQFNVALDGTNNTYTEWAQSWAVAYSLTEKWGVYSEFFGLMPNGAVDINPEYYFNGGFTYLLTNNVQWDIRGGAGLNQSAEDYFLGSGFSIRYNPAACCWR